MDTRAQDPGPVPLKELSLTKAPAACCLPLAAADMSEPDATTTSTVFRALADPHRVRIVNLLARADGPVCVCDLMEPLGLSQPTVSFHLKKLTAAGLLRREQRGTWAFYSIDRDAVGRLSSIFRLDEGRTS